MPFTTGQLAQRKFAIGIFSVFLLGLCAWTYAGLASEKLRLFSAEPSPSGHLVAENFLDKSGFSSGLIVIHRPRPWLQLQSSMKVIESAWPLPEIFFRWTDDQHLVILAPQQPGTPKGPERVGDVQITYSSYNAKAQSDLRSKNKITINPSLVSATFSANRVGVNSFCDLLVSAVDGKTFDKISAKITGSIFKCVAPPLSGRLCANVESEFEVGPRLDRQYGQALTSATISKIRSYNRLPEGVGQTSVRGQFLEQSAVQLFSALGQPSFEIDYSFDFQPQEAMSFVIPTSAILDSITEFKECVGSAHLNWIQEMDAYSAQQRRLLSPETKGPRT